MFEKFLFRSLVGMSVLAVMAFASVAGADTFGTGVNEFDIDFVPISGSTNPTVEQANVGDLDGFGIVNNDYRIGVYEITNDQWDKFKASLGIPVTGSPSIAYDNDSVHTGTNVPTNNVSWLEAAQMVNWLNTSTGHHAAYKFTGTQGDGEGDPEPYTLGVWTAGDAGYDSGNPYRNSNAYYFLPTEDEWVKAAYFNGSTSTLQPYATKAGESLSQGDGTSGTGWNYYDNGHAIGPPFGPWDVGSGSEELNGTYDMMGNEREWVESPYNDPNYGAGSSRGRRGGGYGSDSGYLHASDRSVNYYPTHEAVGDTFRVASIPEPGSMTLLVCGAFGLLVYGWRRRRG